jgi:hypothetical protein
MRDLRCTELLPPNPLLGFVCLYHVIVSKAPTAESCHMYYSQVNGSGDAEIASATFEFSVHLLGQCLSGLAKLQSAESV